MAKSESGTISPLGDYSNENHSCTCKTENPVSASTRPLNLLVYVRYKDHVLFKNIQQPIAQAVERETVGWLTKQNQEIMLIEHDRTIPCAQIPSGQGNGVIIIKSCITEIREVPNQETSNCHLNPPDTTSKTSMRFRKRSEKLNQKPTTRRQQ
jgi:hypothetical protein